MLVMLVSEFVFVFFFKQKTAYEMRISDWSSDVCSSDLFSRSRFAFGLLQGGRSDDCGDREIAVVNGRGGARRQLHMADVDGVTHVRAGQVDDHIIGNAGRITNQFEFVANDVQDRKSTRLNSSH